jgi:hypothetical protein
VDASQTSQSRWRFSRAQFAGGRTRSVIGCIWHLISRIAFLVLFGMYDTFLSAVNTTGMVEGTVQDVTHAVLPGVRISLSNVQTGNISTQVTGPLGRFVFPSLNVGTYI